MNSKPTNAESDDVCVCTHSKYLHSPRGSKVCLAKDCECSHFNSKSKVETVVDITNVRSVIIGLLCTQDAEERITRWHLDQLAALTKERDFLKFHQDANKQSVKNLQNEINRMLDDFKQKKDALKAENAELRKQLKNINDTHSTLLVALDYKRKGYDAATSLINELKKYALHDGCDNEPCTCGLTQLLEGGRE